MEPWLAHVPARLRTGTFDETPAPTEPVPVLELKVTLLELVPAVWRRFRVPANYTLRRLHGVLQSVMGWKEKPAHQFRVGEELFGMWSDGSEGVRDSRWTTLQDLVARGTRSFSYEYRSDSLWVHLVRVEAVVDGSPGNQRPVCLTGERACPPDFCRGPDDYVALLDARHQPPGQGSAQIDPNLDPDAFDLDGINAALAALKF